MPVALDHPFEHKKVLVLPSAQEPAQASPFVPCLQLELVVPVAYRRISLGILYSIFALLIAAKSIILVNLEVNQLFKPRKEAHIQGRRGVFMAVSSSQIRFYVAY